MLAAMTQSKRYTPVQRFHLACLWEQFRSVTVVQRTFARMFELSARDSRPSRDAILSAHETALTIGLASAPHSGRNRSARCEENVQRVVTAVMETPKTSQRRLSQQLNLSKSTIQRILKERKFHPYRLRVLHALNEEDYENRLDFAEEIIQMIDQDPECMKFFFFSDDANFHVSGAINTWNCRYYAQENPNFFSEAPLNSPKLIVWCAVSWKRIIGPFFFKNEDGETINVDGRSYRSMLETFLVPQIEDDEDYQRGKTFFMQDGAPPHTSRENITFLQQCFPGKLISRRGDIPWPPRSPDITPCDFWLWGYLKAKVYSHPIEDLAQLEERIREEVERIPDEMREATILAFKERLHHLVENGGGHVE